MLFSHPPMRTLIVGVGALGGTIATRGISAGAPIWLATRSPQSAAALRASGLRVSGTGGPAEARSVRVAAALEYANAEKFDLIVLATKAQDALEAAPFLARLLAPGASLLCIQNGGVSQMLSERLRGGVGRGGRAELRPTLVQP